MIHNLKLYTHLLCPKSKNYTCGEHFKAVAVIFQFVTFP